MKGQLVNSTKKPKSVRLVFLNCLCATSSVTMSTFGNNSVFYFPVLLLSLLVLTTTTVSCSNILFFHSLITASHRIAIWPLAEKLADKGHNVTYIYPNTKKPGHHPKIYELTPSKMIPILDEFVMDFDINDRLANKELEWMFNITSVSLQLCEAFYDSPEIQEWLARPDLKYDVVMVDGSLGECAYGLVYKFKAKLILFAAVVPPFILDGLGIVPETSSIPDMYLHQKPTEVNLLSRTVSTLAPLYGRYKFLQYISELEGIVWNKLNVTVSKTTASNDNSEFRSPPSLTEIEGSTSLVMVNGHYVEEYPSPLPPSVVSFSGLWCSKEKLQDQKPLPEEMSQFLKDTEGFIYVSFGSSVVASKMPVELRNQFFQAFRKFPKYKFLWRWTGPVPEDTPENAMLLPWFPQRDVLRHPKIKGFLTQAGRPSSQEAICFGIPMITVPIFADQDYNADRLVYIGVAIKLDIAKLTEVDLSNSFDELFHQPTYAKTTKKMSTLFRDRPLDPLENALYWVEYVIRHEDTSILKPMGLHLQQTWYQRRLLDVYAFVTLVILSALGLVLITFILLGRFILRKIVGTNKLQLNKRKHKRK